MSQHRYKIIGYTLFGTVVGAAVAFVIYKRIKKHASTPELDEGIGDVDSIVSETEIESSEVAASAPGISMSVTDTESEVAAKPSDHEYKDALSTSLSSLEPTSSIVGLHLSDHEYHDSFEKLTDESLLGDKGGESSQLMQQAGNGALPLKPKKILLLGLNECGKSSLLNILAKRPENSEYQKTQGFNAVQIEWKNLALSIMEVGGGRETRKYWRNFTNGTDLLVYMVDGSNSQSLEESKEELMRVLNSPDISDVPCLLISNKQDFPGALTAKHVFTKKDLKDVGKTGNCNITLLDTCCIGNSDSQTTLPETILNVLVALLSED